MNNVHHVTTGSLWITDHLAVDARKYCETGVECAGRLIRVSYDNYAQAYKWWLDGREVQRPVVERALDIALLG